MGAYFWSSTPQDNNFNNPNNWTTGIVPGQFDTAVFGTSTITALTFSTGTLVNYIQFNAGAPAYSFAWNSGFVVVGAPDGIINLSSNAETFTPSGNGQLIFGGVAFNFLDPSQFGTVNFTTNGSGSIQLNGNSRLSIDLSNATITTNGNFTISGVANADRARFITNAGGKVDFGGSLYAGSIEGAGTYGLGTDSVLLGFTVGYNNLSTEVSGTIFGNAWLTKTGSGTLTLSGSNSYVGGTIVNAGTVQLGNGGASGSITGSVTDNATFAIDRSDSFTFGGSISGSGVFRQLGTGTTILTAANTYGGGTTISAGTLELGNSQSAGGGAITFAAGAQATLRIDGTVMPSNTIAGFAPGGGHTIDLAGITFDGTGHADIIGHQLVIAENGHTYTLNFDPALDFTGEYFHLSADGVGPNAGTVITEGAVACYCRGTLIAIDRGEVPVEDLAIGDQVMTMSGVAQPIRWIGRRSYSGRFALGQKHILPVCIKAGAIDQNVPRRDLWISPHHAMYLQDVLIEARDLVNGRSIVQAERVERIEYFHIELATHDVIIAEGALSESFIDDDSRGMFHNAAEYCGLYPDSPNVPAHYCAPRRDDGYEVEEARHRIDARAGLRPTAMALPHVLRGCIDIVGSERIAGWAQNVDRSEAPVCLDIFAGGRLIGRTLANRYRGDLARAGLGSGQHGFDFTPPAGIDFAPNAIEVRRSLDGEALPFSTPAARIPVQAIAGDKRSFRHAH
jgi:autotransporter-associated beta strand protein